MTDYKIWYKPRWALGVMGLKDSALYSDSATYPILISTFAGTGLPLNFNNFNVNSGTINAYAEDSYSLTRDEKRLGNL